MKRSLLLLAVLLAAASCTSSSHVADYPERKSPPPDSGYTVSMPEQPTLSYDASRNLVLTVSTNLPSGVQTDPQWMRSYGQGTEYTSGPPVRVRDGSFSVRVPRQCGNWQLETDFGPQNIVIAPSGGPPPVPGAVPSPPPPWQPASIYAMFGKHFENLLGPQVTKQGQMNVLVAKRTYFISTTPSCHPPMVNKPPILSDPGPSIPPGVTSYEVVMPWGAETGGGAAGLHVTAASNLPSGTVIGVYWRTRDRKGIAEYQATVQGGKISLPVPAHCGWLRAVVQVAPTAISPPILPVTSIVPTNRPLQPPSVYATLGANFSGLAGDHGVRVVHWNGRDIYVMTTTHDYMLTTTQGCSAGWSGPSILLPNYG
jgi:hypothetical protein